MVFKFKKGSKIHIKESQKGSFTKYCKGKVTNECIQKGKNSPDPKIRKKATFAANSRKWKHKEGGKAFVDGVNVLDSNPNIYKYQKNKLKVKKAQDGTKFQQAMTKVGDFLQSDNGQNLISAGQSILGGIKQSKQIGKLQSSFNAQNKAYRKTLEQKAINDANIDEQVQKAITNNTDPENTNSMGGSVVRGNLAWKFRNQALQNAQPAIDNEIGKQQYYQNQYIQGLQNQAQNSISNGISGLGNVAVDLLSKKKNASPSFTMSKIESNNFSTLPKLDTTIDMSLNSGQSSALTGFNASTYKSPLDINYYTK